MSDNITRTWHFGPHRWEMGEFPKLMGIVNVTPDSFSDGGQWSTTPAAVEQALRLAEAGADVLDIGGESTRPGATPVTLEEELSRVIPVIEQLAARTPIPISIDTTKAAVAEAALQAGAVIVNDISGLTFDPHIPQVCAANDCGIIVMHIQGTPQTMQLNPRYDDVVREICDWLSSRCDQLTHQGIAPERLMVDPGIGFGKTAQHNFEILTHISAFRTKSPVLIGHSRKGFLKKLIGREVDERLAGTIGVSIALAEQHVDMLRVHDITAIRDALTAWHRLRQG